MCEYCNIAEAAPPVDPTCRTDCGELLRLSDEACRLRSLLARMTEELPQDHELVQEASSLL